MAQIHTIYELNFFQNELQLQQYQIVFNTSKFAKYELIISDVTEITKTIQNISSNSQHPNQYFFEVR